MSSTSKSKETMVKKKLLESTIWETSYFTLITDLGWDYQRMSMSGRQVFDEIHQLLGTIKEDEVYMEI